MRLSEPRVRGPLDLTLAFAMTKKERQKKVARKDGSAISQPRAWYQWTYPADLTEKPCGPGEYQIRVTTDDTPMPIARSKCSDTEGLLYWGETKSLEKRFWLLVRSFANPKIKTKHSAAKKYFASKLLMSTYPLGGIQLRYRPADLPPKDPTAANLWPDECGKNRAVVGEKSGLKSYTDRFGELPPLNSIQGKQLSGPSADPDLKDTDPADDLVEFGDANAVLERMRKSKE